IFPQRPPPGGPPANKHSEGEKRGRGPPRGRILIFLELVSCNPERELARIPAQERQGFRPPQVEMEVALEGESHSAVNLDRVLDDARDFIARKRFRGKPRFADLRITGIRAPSGESRERARLLDGEMHVRELVLHRLKAAHRPAELLPTLHVL